MIKYEINYTPERFSPEQRQNMGKLTSFSEIIFGKMDDYMSRCAKKVTDIIDREKEEKMALEEIDALIKIAALHTVYEYLIDPNNAGLNIKRINPLLMAKLRIKIGNHDLLSEIMYNAVRCAKDYFLLGEVAQ